MQVEVHIMRKYEQDFHGEELRVVVTGFIRPELRFGSLAQLIDRIQQDISIAKVQLEHKQSQAWKDDEFFYRMTT
jgi:riboflavin kinase